MPLKYCGIYFKNLISSLCREVGYAYQYRKLPVITHAFCYDSRPLVQYGIEWYVQNHLLAGFVNSIIKKLCNAKFGTNGDEVDFIATKKINIGDEMFITGNYKIR